MMLVTKDPFLVKAANMHTTIQSPLKTHNSVKFFLPERRQRRRAILSDARKI